MNRPYVFINVAATADGKIDTFERMGAAISSKRDKQRVDELSRQGIISKSEVEAAEASYEVAFSQHADALEEVKLRVAMLSQRRVEHEIARQQLADTKIHAPFDGAILERKANIGEFLPTSAPVVTLVGILCIMEGFPAPLWLRGEA